MEEGVEKPCMMAISPTQIVIKELKTKVLSGSWAAGGVIQSISSELCCRSFRMPHNVVMIGSGGQNVISPWEVHVLSDLVMNCYLQTMMFMFYQIS